MNDNSKVNEPLNNNSDLSMDNDTVISGSDIVDSANSENANSDMANELTVKNTSTRPLNGLDNLKPFSKDNVDKARECGRIGGKKSGETKRKRKEAREYLEKILTTDIPVQNVDEILGEAKILCNEDYSAYNVLWVKLLQLGLSGSEKAIALLRDTVGDKPIDKTSTDLNVITDEDKKQLDKLRKELASITKIG